MRGTNASQNQILVNSEKGERRCPLGCYVQNTDDTASKALSKVYKLPPEEQNAIAAIILEELEDERQWQEVFAESQDKLAQLAHKVRADIKAGHIKKMDIDEL